MTEKVEELALIISKENTVTKSNLLIEAAYKLSSSEFKLIQTIFSNIQPSDTKTHTYSFPIKEFLDLLELKGKSGYLELKKITLDLFKKPIAITIENQTYQFTWLSLVNYNDNKGTITIEIHKFWEQYLLSLTSNFTSYKLFNITNLKSIYSLRLYELLKSRVNLNSIRVITLQDLRAKMGIEPDQYPKYANFKQRIILQAQKELKAESDIYFDFVEIKKGRSVDKIEFHIYRNGPKEPIKNLIIDAVLEEQNRLSEFGLKPKVMSEIIDKYSKEQIELNIAYTKDKMHLGEVKNPAAYVIKAIEDNYASSSIETPKKIDKQEETLKNLKGNNEEAERERFDKPIEEIEAHMLKVKELKELLGTSAEETKEAIYLQLMDYQKYQERTYDKLVSPKKFKDEYLQAICKEVVSNIYSHN
ncbi:replication initiation protein [Psychrobacillus sp. FSL H8-0484]|uniref:replication initiation protein n=1 Tax=Psychrobacillus sp. FSL H8-0484 TaxID=2921390 RepID=UPI0030FB0921